MSSVLDDIDDMKDFIDEEGTSSQKERAENLRNSTIDLNSMYGRMHGIYIHALTEWHRRKHGN